MSGAPSDLLRIARVLKSYGTEGGILAGFRETGIGDLNLKEPVFIMFDGLPVPFFIESISRRGNTKALIRLTGVRTLKDADELAGRDIFSDAFEEEDGEDFTGWALKDQDGSGVGTVTGYEDIPGNLCLVVDTEKGQVLVPLAEELVLSIDEPARTLTMHIPAGLLDI